MFVLIPTYPAYVPIAEITRPLLNRYWPGHPPIEVALDAAGDGWVSTVTRALRVRDDPFFVLLLDDYGLCGPARGDQISRGVDLLRRDDAAAVYSLSWQPAQRRVLYHDSSDTVELLGAPVMLQAAIWRRSTFLELAAQMHPHTTAWAFERLATQLTRTHPLKTLAANMPTPAWIGGDVVDGFDKSHWPVPYHNLMHRGEPNLVYEPFLHAHGLRFPSRGLGDSIARMTHSTGIDRLMPEGCGCAERRAKLNEMLPY